MRAVIVEGLRTPLCFPGGCLSELTIEGLILPLMQQMHERLTLNDADIDGLLLGRALSDTHLELSIEEAFIQSGFPERLAFTQVQADGLSCMRALEYAVGLLLSQCSQMLLVGASESISQHLNQAFLHPSHEEQASESRVHQEKSLLLSRWLGQRQGSELLAAIEKTRLDQHISRQTLDELVMAAQKRAIQTLEQDLWFDQLVPVVTEGGWVTEQDDAALNPIMQENLIASEPFEANSGITPLNTARLADGAALLAVTTDHHAMQQGLMPLATIEYLRFFRNRMDALAFVKREMKQARNTYTPLPYLEICDVCAMDVLDICQQLDLSPTKVNILGGCLATGYPIGASGFISLLAGLVAINSEQYEQLLLMTRDARDRWAVLSLRRS